MHAKKEDSIHSIGTTYCPKSFSTSQATGAREYLSFIKPSGLPRWLINTTLVAPFVKQCFIVGKAATILEKILHENIMLWCPTFVSCNKMRVFQAIFRTGVYAVPGLE